MSDPSATGSLCGLHHVGLTVRDLERSVRFYRDLLGLSLVRRRSADADYLGRQTGYPGVRLEVASFRLAPGGGPTLFSTVAPRSGDPGHPWTRARTSISSSIQTRALVRCSLVMCAAMAVKAAARTLASSLSPTIGRKSGTASNGTMK